MNVDFKRIYIKLYLLKQLFLINQVLQIQEVDRQERGRSYFVTFRHLDRHLK